MKKVILLLIIALSVALLNAQTNENNILFANEKLFELAELVFEGHQIKDVLTYYANHYENSDWYDTYVITEYKVKIVYKGEQSLTGNTIYVVSQGGFFGQEKSDRSIIHSSLQFVDGNGVPRNITENTPQIHFFTTSDFPDETNPKYSQINETNSKYFQYKKYKRIPRGGMYIDETNGARLNNLVFPGREALYDYMKCLEGFIVPELESLPEKVTSKDVIIDTTRYEQQEYNDTILDSFQREVFGEKWKENKKKIHRKAKKNRDYNTLTLQIANQQLFYDDVENKRYVKFDVLASSNNPNIYFNSTGFGLKYNSVIFGDSIINNGKITISVGNYFNNGNYSIMLTPDYPQLVNLFLVSNLISPNRLPLSTIPTILLQFQIEILPNIAYEQSFFSFVKGNAYGTYTLLNNSHYSENIYYDMVFLIDSDTIPIPPENEPVITTPLHTLSKKAGIGEILTIEGGNFGNIQGTVCFKAADNGGQSYLKGLDEQYIKNWSNTQIEVIVPSYISKAYQNDTTKRGGACTGSIKIITDLGDSCISSTHFKIHYAITNDIITNGSIRRVYLAKQHCDYDFLFILHSDFQYHPEKIAVIDTALHHWSAFSGLNLMLERDPVTNNPTYAVWNNTEGKFIIKPITTINVMGTSPTFTEVIVNNNDTVLYRSPIINYAETGIHINLMPQNNMPGYDYSWHYGISDTVPIGKQSFYHAFLHELGHILLLEHVNDSTELMHYMLPSRLVQNSIIELISSSTPVLAVKDNITTSQVINWSAAIPSTPPLHPIGGKKPKISILSHEQPILCSNDIMILSSNYPTGNLWSTGDTTQTIQISVAGNYTLAIIDGECAFSDSIIITPSTLTSSFAVTHVACYGDNTGSITTQVTGTHPPYTYQWTGNGINASTQNISNLPAGTYYLSLSNSAGCTKQYTVSVSQPEELTLNIVLPPNPIGRESYQANVTGGTPPYTYIWQYVSVTGKAPCNLADYLNSPIIPTSCETATCKLKLVVTDSLGCQIEAIPRGEKMPLNSTTINNEVRVIPNPTSGSFTITNIQDATIYLYSAQSAYMKTFEHITNNEAINISHLSSGIYFLKIIDGNTIKNEKLILFK